MPLVGLGTAFIGFATHEAAHQPMGTVVPDAEIALRTLDAAITNGSTLIDTAPLYGDTRTEQHIGSYFSHNRAARANCTIATKVGRTITGRDYSEAATLKSVEESLHRLGLDRLDIVSVHDAPRDSFREVIGKNGALAALRKLRDEKVIGAIGIACSNLTANEMFVATGEFDVCLATNAWSLLSQKLHHKVFSAAEEHGIGIIVGSPFERGVLAEAPTSEARQYRARNITDEVRSHVLSIHDICQSFSIPLGAVALQWCTRDRRVASVLAGARTDDEATTNAEWARWDIPEELWRQVDPLVSNWDIHSPV